MKQPFVIGICGGSGSGKTTLANRIVALAPERTILLSQDDYYRDLSALPYEDRLKVNFDRPEALENDLLVRHLRALKEGKAVECPRYDFKTAVRFAETRHVEPLPVILVEGILIFHFPELLRELDLKIFVDLDEDEAFARRVVRDMAGERSTDINWIASQYVGQVKPMYERYVEPTRVCADLVVSGKGDHTMLLAMLDAYLRVRMAE